MGLSLLTNFKEIKDPENWVVGKHGIKISFKHKGQTYDSTFLPEVAEEEGWSVKQTMQELVTKSGYPGKYN